MQTITLDKKKFVIIEEKQFEKIQLQAAQKAKSSKKLTLAEGKQYAYDLIDKWAKEK